jgi:hypothetical protein
MEDIQVEVQARRIVQGRLTAHLSQAGPKTLPDPPDL